MPYKEQIQHLVDLENAVLINIDDSLLKSSEEHAEFTEALLSKNTENILDEAADAVINTLCATLRVCNTIPEEYAFFGQWDIVQNTINHWKWIRAIQTERQRYTRSEKTITQEEIMNYTRKYVEWVIETARTFDGTITLDSLIAHSLWKIEWRMEQYLPQINLEEYIRDDLKFKPWIVFKDITPLLASPEALSFVTESLAHKAKSADVIVGLDARWFIFGSIIAYILKKPFVMARKPDKMPWELYSIEYWLEYWTNILTIQKDAIQPWQKVAIIDDLLATGWSAEAGAKLVELCEWDVDGQYFVIELDGLNGREKLQGSVESILHY